MLLEVGGLDEKWEEGHVLSWQGKLGQHDNNNNRISQAIRRLLTPTQARNYDTSGMGMGCDQMRSDEANNQHDDNNSTVYFTLDKVLQARQVL